MNEDGDHDIEPDDEDASWAEGQRPESKESSEGDDKEQGGGFRMPTGFSRSLLPNLDDYLASVVAPLQERMRSLVPDYSAIAREALAPMNERIGEQVASIVASIPTFSTPAFDLPALHAPVLDPATQEMLKTISEQHARTMAGLRKSLGPLFEPEALRGLNHALLPPNLKEHADEIRASQVHEFVEQEGIPLYLVPRGGRPCACCEQKIARGGDGCSGTATNRSWRTAPPCWNGSTMKRSAMSWASPSMASARCAPATPVRPRPCSLSRWTR